MSDCPKQSNQLDRHIKYLPLNELIKYYFDNIYEIQEKYMKLLSNLSTVEEIPVNKFIDNILTISKTGIIIVGYVGKPGLSNDSDSVFEIICTGTLFLELKLSHGGRPVGHIEDIIVHPNYRGKHLSFFIVNKLVSWGILRNCYKLILQCKPELCSIYERNGFKTKGVEMVFRI